MANRYRGSSIGNVAASSLTLNVPPGTANGDVMYALIAGAPFSIGLSTPPGWTLLASGQVPNGNWAAVYRRVAFNEPVSHTWIWSGATVMYGLIETIIGSSLIPEDAATAQASGSTATITYPSITTLHDLAWHLAMVFENSGAAISTPTNYTLRGVNAILTDNSREITPAGLVSGVTSTGGSDWIAFSIALRALVTAANPDIILWPTEAAPWDIRLRDPSETGGGGPTPIVGTDSGVLTEAIASLIVLVATGETVAASEAASVLVLASAADSVAATEAAAIQVIVAGAETLGATDAVASLISLVTGADTATAAESAALIVSVAQNDPLAATDAVASLLVLLAVGDAASLSESNSILALLSGADAVTATEGATVTILVLVTGSDTVAATEAGQLQASLSAADTVGAADGTAAGLATLLADDPVTAAELAELLVALAADDAATATENQAVDTGAPPITVTDGETLTATEGAQIFAFAPAQDSGWSQTRHIRVVSEVRTGAGELLRARENAWVDVVWQLVVGVDQLHATESALLRKSQSQEQSIAAITLLMDIFEDE